MKITKDYLRRLITEEIENIQNESDMGQEYVAAGPIAVIDYDEGGIIVSDGWRPPQRLDFLSFEDIEGPEDDPRTSDEMEEIISTFFAKNKVGSVRDEQMDVSSIEPQEWLSTMIMNHPAGSDRRPPEHTGGGHSVRDLRAQGIDPSDPEAF